MAWSGVAAIKIVPISSKLPPRRAKNEFYRYYAGYPVDFAEWALRELKLPPSATVIDPWNGSGTTAAACARYGVSCQGYDISPVMVHLGRARVASSVDFGDAAELIDAVEELLCSNSDADLQTIGSAFRELPVTNETAHSVAVASLFPFARKLLSASKTKNPSWFKRDAAFSKEILNVNEFFSTWRQLAEQMSFWRSLNDENDGFFVSIRSGDSRKSLGRKDTYDGLLTSPPYLTRLDYVQATLPELLLLREFDVIPNMQRLRRSMLGSPLTSQRPTYSLERLPNKIKNLLDKIKNHESKASSTYYYRFFSTYFVDLQASMRNIVKALKPGATGCMVLQSSQYKEININLACAVVEIGKEIGFFHKITYDFQSGRSISVINTRAHAEARKPKSESAVFLRKE